MSQSFQATLRRDAKNDSAFHGKKLRYTEIGKEIVERVLATMPHTLESHFQVSYFYSFGSGFSPDSLTLHFKPSGSRLDEKRHRIALGTIDKVVAALTEDGWSVQGLPRPEAIQHDRGWMNIRVHARKEIPLPNGARRGLRGLRRMVVAPQRVALEFIFGAMPENDRCRVVEREVTIPAEAEHTETRMVVVCDEEEPG